MENQPYTTSQTGVAAKAKLHPLVAAAAISLIVLSAVGVATLLYGHSSANDAVPADPAQTAALLAPPAGTPAPAPATGNMVASNSPSRPVSRPSQPSYSEPAPVAQAPVAAACYDCATVESVTPIKVKAAGSGVGAVGGGVVGGLLGNQVGGGRGRTAATLLGAVGGAFAGNAIEKNVNAKTEYRLEVRMEDGTSRSFTRVDPWPYASGDRVRVVDNQVVARN